MRRRQIIKNMKILHYIPSIDRTSGGVGAYMQLLTAELGKLVELHVVTHREKNPLELENCKIHFIKKNNNPPNLERLASSLQITSPAMKITKPNNW